MVDTGLCESMYGDYTVVSVELLNADSEMEEDMHSSSSFSKFIFRVKAKFIVMSQETSFELLPHYQSVHKRDYSVGEFHDCKIMVHKDMQEKTMLVIDKDGKAVKVNIVGSKYHYIRL